MRERFQLICKDYSKITAISLFHRVTNTVPREKRTSWDTDCGAVPLIHVRFRVR
jgi:hypothetical protein